MVETVVRVVILSVHLGMQPVRRQWLANEVAVRQFNETVLPVGCLLPH